MCGGSKVEDTDEDKKYGTFHTGVLLGYDCPLFGVVDVLCGWMLTLLFRVLW